MNRRLSDQFQLRLPDGMRDKLRRAAEDNDQSMNAEIVERLNQSFNLWPGVYITPGTREIVESAPTALKIQFQNELEEFVMDLTDKYFPREEDQFSIAFGIFLDGIDKLENNQKIDISLRLSALMKEAISKLPDEDRSKAVERNDWLFEDDSKGRK